MKKRQTAVIITSALCMSIMALADYKNVSASSDYNVLTVISQENYETPTLQSFPDYITGDYYFVEKKNVGLYDILPAEDSVSVNETPETPAEAPVEDIVAVGTVLEEYVSAYIPQATIQVIKGENEDTVQTVFKSGKVFYYNIDEYLDEVDEVELLYHLVQAEGGNQSSLARRLIADCVLNQRDSGKYPDTIKGVILTPGDFEVVATGSIFKVTPSDSTIECVDNELESRIDYAVMYFRTKHFHTFGVPYDQVGDCYFSKAVEDNSSQWSE